MWRLMPFLFLLYIVAYLDRINVSFAVLQMRGQLGISDRVYGRAAGMFFAGYFFFQLPSNLVLEKFGVRRWISGLMVTWGVISCLMIFIRGPISFYGMRFLLGAAEAGFFPGMILYMKRWFPANARARAVAWFMTANPIAGHRRQSDLWGFARTQRQRTFGLAMDVPDGGRPCHPPGSDRLLGTRRQSERRDLAEAATSGPGCWSSLAVEQQAESAALKRAASGRFSSAPGFGCLSLVYFGVSTTMYGVTCGCRA